MKIINKIRNFFKRLFKGSLFKHDLLAVESVVNYIFTAQNLPDPLSNDDEIDCVNRFINFHDLEAKSALIEHNLRLVMYIAKKFENNRLDMQDLVSVGSIGLIKAVDSYKPDKNIKLATYASRCIENEILMFIRKANKSINDLSLDDCMTSEDDETGLSLAEVIPDNKEAYSNIELEDQKKYLLQAIEKLNEREKEIMCMRYGINGYEEQTQKEIADSMNISQSYISRLEKKILHKLRKQIDGAK